MPQRYRSLSAFIQWQQAKRPICWPEAFSREAPLILEIGCGNGEYLVREAALHPECDFIGLDQEWTAALRLLRRVAMRRLSNVRALYGDARVILERSFKPESLADSYALFPCPWPKQSHAKHRLFSKSFLEIWNSRLQPEAEARIVTDDAAFRDWIIGQAAGTGFDADAPDVPVEAETLYARRWRKMGRSQFHKLYLRKQRHCPIGVKEDAAMHTYKTEHFNPDRFEPKDSQHPFCVEFREFLYDPKREKGMTRVMVVEEPLTQDLWIEIARVERCWRIRPAWGCRMIPTAGVQQALDLAHEAVQRSAVHG
jgi:tRNA (guanine-N7-)-methyltransferase